MERKPEHSARHKRDPQTNPSNAGLRPGAEIGERLRRGGILWRICINAQGRISAWHFGDWSAHASNPPSLRE